MRSTGSDDQGEFDIPDTRAENDIEQVTLDKERLTRLKSYIDGLDDKSRDILFLYSKVSKSREIGSLMGMVPVTVRVSVARIIKKLRKILAEDD